MLYRNNETSERDAIDRLRRNGIEIKIETRKFGETEVEAKKIYLPMERLASGHFVVTSLGLKLWGVVDFLCNFRGFRIIQAG